MVPPDPRWEDPVPEGGPRPLPDFAIIGAAKSATTSLANLLSRHPHIFFCPIKEPLFFAYERYYSQGFDAYRSLFEGARPDQLCGEASTDYTRHPQVPGVPARLAAANPEARLIYLLRHPVERAYSHFVHRYTKEVHPGQPFRAGFSDYVKQDPMCIDSSLYAMQIEQWLECFPLERILILTTAELRDDLPAAYDRVLRFLGLEPSGAGPPVLDAIERNDSHHFLQQRLIDEASLPLRSLPWIRGIARTVVPERTRTWLYRMMMRTPRGRRLQRGWTPPPLEAEERRRWLDFFEPHDRRLERLLGREFPEWRR